MTIWLIDRAQVACEPAAPADAPRLTVTGRPRGTLRWLLPLVGIRPQAALTVTGHALTLEATGPDGSRRVFCPLAGLRTVAVYDTRPIWRLLLAVVLAGAGAAAWLVGGDRLQPLAAGLLALFLLAEYARLRYRVLAFSPGSPRQFIGLGFRSRHTPDRETLLRLLAPASTTD